MKRSLLLASALSGALIFTAQGAFAFEPTYNTKVPDLLGKLLESRGAQQTAVEGTKRAVAGVVTAEGAALGQTVGRFAWLAIRRLPIIG